MGSLCDNSLNCTLMICVLWWMYISTFKSLLKNLLWYVDLLQFNDTINSYRSKITRAQQTYDQDHDDEDSDNALFYFSTFFKLIISFQVPFLLEKIEIMTVICHLNMSIYPLDNKYLEEQSCITYLCIINTALSIQMGLEILFVKE